jgi:CBS-domain-containing membrane protein
MTNTVITTTGNSPLHKVVELMEHHHIKRLPVTRRRKVVGIITRANLTRALASIHRATPKTSGKDAVIRNRILCRIDPQSRAFERVANNLPKAPTGSRIRFAAGSTKGGDK